MTREPLPHHVSGWAQTRLFPPESIELTISVLTGRQRERPWHFGGSLTDDGGTAIAIESLWIPDSLQRRQILMTTIGRWVRSQEEAYEPF